jgi:hypothetical protein
MLKGWPIVAATERPWVRLIGPILVAVSLPAIAVIAFPDSVPAQIYLGGLFIGFCVLGVVVLSRRNLRLARAADESAGRTGGGVLCLFERAALAAPQPEAIVQQIGRGWLARDGNQVVIWTLADSAPVATFPISGASVDSAHGGFYSRPLARFFFDDGRRFDAVVVRSGFADLHGWSAHEIKKLTSPPESA